MVEHGDLGRISVFDKNGRFLRTIGKTGTGPGEFRTPHATALWGRATIRTTFEPLPHEAIPAETTEASAGAPEPAG